LWDVTTGKELAVLRGHELKVKAIAFSPNGTRLATGSYDNTARLWEITTGKELAVLRGHEEFVNAIAFSPDGRWLATGSWDKTARLWRVFPDTQSLVDYARATLPRHLTSEQRRQFYLPPDPALDEAEKLVAEGEQHAKAGRIAEATASFHAALEKYPAIGISDPQLKAEVLAGMEEKP
jgi:dipeptidyl aminopeptidase/acylaminoacyl peptidase